jgi:hypothetical protein
MRIHHNLKFGKQPDVPRVMGIAKKFGLEFLSPPTV